MIALEDLVLALSAQIPQQAGGPAHGVELVLDSLEITLPIESRLMASGRLCASAPRGSWRSGFDLPHGELHLGFTSRKP
ncbi:MAG: hypothetical protein IPI49_08115 [Myxococcales bacterium]|nr:hypothetical protein [Myxococcales bacterium]